MVEPKSIKGIKVLAEKEDNYPKWAKSLKFKMMELEGLWEVTFGIKMEGRIPP